MNGCACQKTALDNPSIMNLGTSLHVITHRSRGFTLIEIMIAVAIVAILAAIALPSFMDSIRKSRRADAFAALNAVQQAQERWRANKPAYAEGLTLAPAAPAPPGLGLPTTSSAGRYDIALSATGATGYTTTATAVVGSSQAADGNCSTLTVELSGGNIRFGSGAPPDWTDASRCWAR